MFTVRFRVPSDFSQDEMDTVVGELKDWGGQIETLNPLRVSVDEDVEDIMGIGMDYGLEVEGVETDD